MDEEEYPQIDEMGITIPPGFGPANTRREPQFSVVLYNCDCHNQEQVMFALQYFLGYSQAQAYEKMMAIHLLGETIVITTHQEAAEHYQYQFSQRLPGSLGHGLRCDIKPVNS